MFQKAKLETLIYVKICFNRKAHTNFPELYFCTQYFCCILTSNRRQFDVKMKSTLNRFYFGPPIYVFNHFNAINSITMQLI